MQSQNFTDFEIWHGPSKGARTREVGIREGVIFLPLCALGPHLFLFADNCITVSIIPVNCCLAVVFGLSVYIFFHCNRVTTTKHALSLHLWN